MARNDSLWYTLGRTAQAVRALIPEGGSARASGGDAGDDEELDAPRPRARRGRGGTSATAEGLFDDPTARVLTGALAAVVTAGIVKWARANRPSARRLARGALAGAAAAGIVLAGRAYLDSRRRAEASEDPDEWDDAPTVAAPDIMAELLAGAGRGVLYTAFLDPLLPGPPLLKGALVGSVEHLAEPLGGLYSALEPVSPLRKVPFVSALLRVGGGSPHPFAAHLANGILLGLLCGRAPAVTREPEAES